MLRHILVPTDGSPLSTRAVKFALRLARSEGARVTALHAIPPFSPPAYADSIAPYAEPYTAADYRRATEAHAKRMLAKVQALAKAAKVPLDALQVKDAQPWKAIVRAGRRCDLIVMASHGRRGLEALLLGSETSKVLTHSKTPVLVCR